jgi:hypothetical protein
MAACSRTAPFPFNKLAVGAILVVRPLAGLIEEGPILGLNQFELPLTGLNWFDYHF